MRLLARVGIIFLALLAALFVAGNIYMILDYWPDGRLMLSYGLPHGSLATVLSTAETIASSLAFGLFVLVIALAELYALRSPLFHAACGVAVLVLLRFDFSARFRQSYDYGLFDRAGLTLFATGLAFGLVYWALAGRKAGEWRRQEPLG